MHPPGTSATRALWYRLGTCVGLALAGPSLPANADEFDAIRTQIQQELVDQSIPSLSVAVARNGQIIWEQGFGWADRENQIRATEHTLYSLASISKPITATGLMVLVERGLLDLDKPANDYLGEAPLRARVGAARDATVRRLANHSSGLPLHYQFFYEDEPFARPSRDESIRRYGQLHTPPGERFQYANFGYGVLDHILERVAGEAFGDFMRKEVFLPLGMTRMAVNLAPGLEGQHAVRYGSDQLPIPFYDFDHPGGSAVYSSAHDLVRFGMFHLNQLGPDQKRILQPSSLETMQRPTADAGQGRGYGVGWFVDPDEHGVRTVSHSGGMGGVRTQLTLVPDERLVVVALCNFSSELPTRTKERILARLIPKYAEHLNHEVGAASDEPNSVEPKSVFEPPAELIGHWRGAVYTYQGDRPLDVWVKETGDVHVQLRGQLVGLLNEPRWEEGQLSGVLAGDIDTTDANRRPYHLHVRWKLRGEILTGSTAAISLPGRRAGNALSYWTELKRVLEESMMSDQSAVK